jgi:diguanylate cyclase (GGDEF)-like protein/PAS domain S-box-containing protein
LSLNPVPPMDAPTPPWFRRVHAALMPDYNRAATTYWWLAVALGAMALLLAVWNLIGRSPSAMLQVLVGAAVAMLAGGFPVRIANSKNAFAAGEVFIFLLLLVHGPAAAVIAAAGEAFVGSYRVSKRWTSRIASPAMAALAMSLAGTSFEALRHELEARGAGGPGGLLAAASGFAVLYFVANALMVTAVPRLKRGEGLKAADLFGLFGWVGIACVGSATLAVLLYQTFLHSGIGVLAAMVPLLATMLAALHYFFRQQEVAESARAANADAADRERELAARHVRELEASERRFHSAFTHASIGMALLGFEGRILQANPALCALLGHDDESLLKSNLRQLVHDDDRRLLDQQMGLVSDIEFEGFAMELRFGHGQRSACDEPVWAMAHCSFFSEPGASAPCLILQLQDVSARRKAEQSLHHIAFHDSLTGLPNRRRFHEILAEAVQRALSASERHSRFDAGAALDGVAPEATRGAFAVMFLDFDRFKLINDSLGHSAGDEFLVQVAHRIQGCLREHDVVARLGGDEFAVLVRELTHERDAVHLAERLMDALRRPFHVAGTELITSASIGITFSALGYTSPEAVLRDADIAMYKAKGAGKARYALFDASLHTEVAQRLRLEGELRHAIDEGKLTVAYQPVFGLGADGSQRVSGFEALVRWNHQRDGIISPADFLPIAEEAGLMLRLTDFVLHCACRQLREWQQLGPQWARLTMNVNVSGNDIAHAAFVARVTRALVEAGVGPQHLCIELTENILMSRLEGALPVLGELRRLGVKLAIDDFGTGYSSLSHLSTLPIDVLKIDRSFVMRLDSSGSNESAVVNSIVLLGSSLGKEVVAEGVETTSQLEQLRAMRCRYGQGYLLSRPLPPAEVPALLNGLRKRPNATEPDPQTDVSAELATESATA